MTLYNSKGYNEDDPLIVFTSLPGQPDLSSILDDGAADLALQIDVQASDAAELLLDESLFQIPDLASDIEPLDLPEIGLLFIE
jgi:hypothetical protein